MGLETTGKVKQTTHTGSRLEVSARKINNRQKQDCDLLGFIMIHNGKDEKTLK